LQEEVDEAEDQEIEGSILEERREEETKERKQTSGSPPHSPVSATILVYFWNPSSVIIPSSVAPAVSSPPIDGRKAMKSSL
jgi:hypothetical protein